MENIFIEFLPPWVETGLQPAFYDKESGTVLQQVARMYAKMQEVVKFVNKYIEEFHGLYTYVHDYFDNLDLQQEVNNKLDAMAEDGTLQEIIADYIQAKVAWTFDNVTDMKASTNLIDGSYAQTLGYSTANDGGAGLYKITDDVLTPDEGSVIDLGDGLFAQLIYGNEINVAQFGINNLSTSNLSNLVSFINANNINKVVFNPISYNIDDTLNINTGDITLDGNNCNITLGSTAGQKVIFNITSPNVTVKNFDIYGNEDAQDQWEVSDYADICDRRPFAITGRNVTVKNVNIYNVWGCGLRFYNYTNVLIENCILDKIGGGLYHTDSQGIYDNFGDAMYFSGHNGVANISINNVYCNGYVDTEVTGKGSRGGIILENLGDYTIENTNVSVNNSTFLHFNRFIHEENYSVNTNIEVNDCIILQDASISTDHCPLKLNRCDITFTNKTYAGSVGFRGYQGTFTDCTFDTSAVADGGWLAQGGETNHKYIRCTIPIVTSHAVVSNGKVECYYCNFNVDNSFTSYILYNSPNSKFVNCTFTNSTNDVKQLSQSGSKLKIYNSVFNSVIPYFEGDNISNVYFGDTNNPSGEQLRNPAKLGMMSVTVSGSLVSNPNIGDAIPADNQTNIYYCATNPEFNGGSLPFMPTIKQPLKRNNRFIIVWCASDGDQSFLFNNAFDHGYYAVCTTDSNKAITYGTVSTMGNPGSYNRSLTFDTDAHTITADHTSTKRLNYYILPYSYLGMLRRMSV